MIERFGSWSLLTRDSDETLSPTERVNRVKNAFGDSKDVIVISNHINAGGADISYCEWLYFIELIIFFLFFHMNYELYYLHI